MTEHGAAGNGRGPWLFHAGELLRNLAAGARLALFLPLRASEFRVSAPQFALLVAFNFVFWVGAAAARAGFEGDFDSSAITVYLATVALVLATALLVALAYRAPEHLLLFATALTASDPVFELAGLALPALGASTGHAQALYLGFLAWAWLIALRAALVCGGWRRPRVYLAAAAVSVMTALAFFVLPQTEVWQPPPAEEERADALVDERVFHLQGQLIERALAAIARGKQGVAELYFVGFAPDASQDVFLREMRFVKHLFDERFGTAARSIALASSHTALEELPIASTTNLSRALMRVGETMNTDEDVLFLFLTAHGDREHRLSASQPPLQLAQLTPTALARMLQDAGVKWRVIVVSACYAGGFIEPLRDDNSIVITAAAPDRTSFGCEAGRDFTYFGEAYFRDALAQTRSFTAAFELARDLVSKKEASENLTPSLPQMWAGPAIAERLKNLPN
jgi:Peptidase C13 family